MLKFSPTRLLLCATLFAGTTLHAQMHKVEAPEKVTRAVSVYEWTGDLAKPTAARLVPVTVFIDNEFQDGGSYYARPVPLALLNGNIYSLEKAGVPQGNITLDFARHLQTTGTENAADLGWFGYGTFSALPVARKSRALHASANTPVIISSNDPDRPTLIRRNSSSTPTTSGSKTTTTTGPSAPDDPDRPHLTKAPAASTQPPPDPSDPKSASTPPPAETKTASTTQPSETKTDDSRNPADDSDRPTLRRRDPKQAAADRKARSTSSVTAIGSPNDDPDRPSMRRGETATSAAIPQLTGVPADLHQIVAVSDPANREPHPFAREWSSPDERADILTRLEVIAQKQLATYNLANGVTPPPPPPPATKPRSGATSHIRHLPITPPAPPTPAPAPLASEEITPYTLSYGGLPTFVYTVTSTPDSTSSPSPALPQRYITLVAQQLPSGELQVAFASVTDATHLDRTPWFRLIDAVDPDAEHRASLLFELRGQTARQFALYRILSATADQIFVTNPTF